MSLSSILWVGDGRIPSACQMHTTRLASSADLVIPFLPSSGCSPTGDSIMNKAVALPPPVALSEIRIYTTVGRCVHSWSLSHCYSITASTVTTGFLKNNLILTIFFFFKKPSFVAWHMVQSIGFSVLCTSLLVIVPQSSFLLPLLAGTTRTWLGLSDKCFKIASNSMGWNLAG